MDKREKISGWMFAIPGVLFFGVFSFYPLLNAFWISLFDYDMLTEKKWAGFDNYIYLWNNDMFWKSIWNTIYFVFGTCIPVLSLAVFFAVLLNSKIRLKTYYRLLFFLPVITSEVIAVVVWLLMYNPDGPINNFLMLFGMNERLTWLDNSTLAMPAIIILTIWYRLGYFIVLILAGLQGIPADLYESAKVDGANAWKGFWSITFPLLKPTMGFAATIALIQAVTVFIPSMLLTNGGPNGSTTVLSLLIYQTGFVNLEMGRASAMSVVLFISVMFITVIQLRFLFREEV